MLEENRFVLEEFIHSVFPRRIKDLRTYFLSFILLVVLKSLVLNSSDREKQVVIDSLSLVVLSLSSSLKLYLD